MINKNSEKNINTQIQKEKIKSKFNILTDENDRLIKSLKKAGGLNKDP
tara:strand:- start:127 stop:270 length:144 start_codon:yes stop_codon:yes gene_type:complete